MEGSSHVDAHDYEVFLKGFGTLSGVTPAIAGKSGVDVSTAVRVTCAGTVRGVLLLREWVSPAKSSRMVVYLLTGGRLLFFSVWRGSASYREVVSTPLGSPIVCSFARSGAERVVCKGVSAEEPRPGDDAR